MALKEQSGWEAEIGGGNGKTGIMLWSYVESKALAACQKSTPRNSQFFQDGCITAKRGRLRESLYRNESAAWTPLFQQSDSRFRPSICQKSKTSTMEDEEVLESPICSFHLFLCISCQLTEIREWKQDSQNVWSQENTLCDTNGISQGIRDCFSWHQLGPGEPAVQSGPPWAQSTLSLVRESVLGQGHGNHLTYLGEKQNNQNQNPSVCLVYGIIRSSEEMNALNASQFQFSLSSLVFVYWMQDNLQDIPPLVYFLVKVKHSNIIPSGKKVELYVSKSELSLTVTLTQYQGWTLLR